MKKLSLCALIMALLLPAAKPAWHQTKKCSLDSVLELAATQSTSPIAKQGFVPVIGSTEAFKRNICPHYRSVVPLHRTKINDEQVYTGGEWKYIKSIFFNLRIPLFGPKYWLTGGSIAVNSSLGFQNNLERESSNNYRPLVNIRADPTNIKYNSLKWQKKHNPCNMR